MKQDWEIKKLGEVCTFYNGYTPSKDNLQEFGSIPYFKVSDMNHNDNQKYLVYTSLYLEKGCKTYPKYSIVFPKNGAAIATNKKRILGQDSVVDLNTGGVFADKNIIRYDYLYLYLLHIDFQEYTRRGAVPTLDIAELKNLSVPVPERAEQERIVGELDCLSGIIAAKRAQLRELDTLAQSIFYTMFGDPITNDKGWQTKKFGDIFRLKSGDSLSSEKYMNGDFPVYGGNGISGFHDTFNKNGEYLIIGRVGAYCGNVRYVIGKFWLTDNAFEVIMNTNDYDNQFLCILLNVINLHQYANHAAQPVISNSGLKNVMVISPSIDLQKQFAEKIENIERQKELITKSIKETEDLCNSRMSYYFD